MCLLVYRDRRLPDAVVIGHQADQARVGGDLFEAAAGQLSRIERDLVSIRTTDSGQVDDVADQEGAGTADGNRVLLACGQRPVGFQLTGEGVDLEQAVVIAAGPGNEAVSDL